MPTKKHNAPTVTPKRQAQSFLHCPDFLIIDFSNILILSTLEQIC